METFHKVFVEYWWRQTCLENIAINLSEVTSSDAAAIYLHYDYTTAQPTNTQLEMLDGNKTLSERKEQIFSWQLDIKYYQIYYEELIS